MSAIRYVHQNPVKACIGSIESYRWSSYKAYIHGSREIETDEVLALISKERQVAVKEFLQFNKEDSDEIFIDLGVEKEINESSISSYIDSYLAEKNLVLEDLRYLQNRKQRDELIRTLSVKSDLSGRSIANILGINRETVRRLSKEPSP